MLYVVVDRKKPNVQGAEGATNTSEMPEADQVCKLMLYMYISL